MKISLAHAIHCHSNSSPPWPICVYKITCLNLILRVYEQLGCSLHQSVTIHDTVRVKPLLEALFCVQILSVLTFKISLCYFHYPLMIFLEKVNECFEWELSSGSCNTYTLSPAMNSPSSISLFSCSDSLHKHNLPQQTFCFLHVSYGPGTVCFKF
jgi:hypothetical protein